MTLATQVVSGNASTAGWITEWAGPKGRKAIGEAVMNATPLYAALADLVAQYVRKLDIYDLKTIQDAYGKKELAALLGEIGPEFPIPSDLEDCLQANLSQYFSAKVISKSWPGKTKVTEAFPVYYKPQNVTANISEKLAAKHQTQFHEYSWKAAIQEHGNTPSDATPCWMLFPDEPIGRGETFDTQLSLIAAPFEAADFWDGMYCIFTKYACTKIQICGEKPLTFIRFKQLTAGWQLAAGGFGARGPDVFSSDYDCANNAVAPLWKFFRALALGPSAIGNGH